MENQDAPVPCLREKIQVVLEIEIESCGLKGFDEYDRSEEGLHRTNLLAAEGVVREIIRLGVGAKVMDNKYKTFRGTQTLSINYLPNVIPGRLTFK